MRAQPYQVRLLKRLADSISLTADGVVPLDLTCSPSRDEVLLGPAGTAYTNNGIVMATNGSLKRDWSLGAAMVAKDFSLPARFQHEVWRSLANHRRSDQNYQG